MNSWRLPNSVEICGKDYKIATDFRDILEIISYLNDQEKPELIRWYIALNLFYTDGIPSDQEAAMQKLSDFISEGEEDEHPGPKLIDWDQDAKAIIADVNKVAGTEIRSIPYLHWWTFLAYFRGIGEGQLSTIVSIRSKIAKHKKLEDWEREYYKENKNVIDFRHKYTQAEKDEQERLIELLDGK